MTPEQRESFLAKKSPEVRERILAKINEYAALDPGERDLRLRATELRWYLMPLLRARPEDRAAQLVLVPADIHDLVKARLMLWEMLPPTVQAEFLENEPMVGYFSGIGNTNSPVGGIVPTDADQARWNSLSDEKRTAMTAQFNQFFELSPMEKEKALGILSDAERAQMQKTLDTFDKLPPPQRIRCIRAFGKFASLSPQERAEFLKNAERWSQMSPAERKAWEDLVAHVPQWPMGPPVNLMPPAPRIPPSLHPVVATNQS
jgi:hypothetical protein